MTKSNKMKQHDEILAAAAKWLLRHQEGNLSSEEFALWEAWRSECDEHDIAYCEIELTWQELDLIEDISLPTQVGDLHSNNFNFPGVPEKHQAIWGHRIRTKISALLKLLNKGCQQLSLPGATVASLGMVVSVCGALVIVYFTGQTGIEQTGLQVYETGIAEHRLVYLADESQIEMGARTTLIVNYTNKTRTVELTLGEALFSVMKDSTRPFIVNAGNGEITAIGTKFNIHQLGSQVIVTVVEGSVAVASATNGENDEDVSGLAVAGADSGKVIYVSVEQEVNIEQDGRIGEVRRANTSHAISWRNHILNFVDLPLGDAIKDVNRYSDREIIIMDRNTKMLKISGTYFTGQLDDWLAALAQVYSLRIVPAGYDKVLIM